MVAATERLLHEKAPRIPVLETLPGELGAAVDPAAQEKAGAQENCLAASKLNSAA